VKYEQSFQKPSKQIDAECSYFGKEAISDANSVTFYHSLVRSISATHPDEGQQSFMPQSNSGYLESGPGYCPR
jgi:hypothetical protein